MKKMKIKNQSNERAHSQLGLVVWPVKMLDDKEPENNPNGD